MPRWGSRFFSASRTAAVTSTSTSYQAPRSGPFTKDIVGLSSPVLLSPATSSYTMPRSIQPPRAIFLNVAQTESEPHAE